MAFFCCSFLCSGFCEEAAGGPENEDGVGGASLAFLISQPDFVLLPTAELENRTSRRGERVRNEADDASPCQLCLLERGRAAAGWWSCEPACGRC